MVLPCKHEQRMVRQVRPAIELLTHLDQWHPDILRAHEINPADYHEGLVFRSAVESIRGTFIAATMAGREAMVAEMLEAMAERGQIVSYAYSGRRARYDFTVQLDATPEYFIALEVKGGEGNSLNISERPLWAREFVIWSHLDGAIVNAPAHGAHAVVNRLTHALVRQRKQVDLLLFKDALCGTRARPCPKYAGLRQEGLIAPDFFFFPQRAPTPNAPHPPVHTLDTLRFPVRLLTALNVPREEWPRHLWSVDVELLTLPQGRFRRRVQVWHEGKLVDETLSRAWRSGL